MATYSDVSTNLDTQTPGGTFGGISINDTRRIFGIGDTVHSLSPEQSLFFTYLSKVSKQSVDDTVWKPLEYRHQWQRRNFYSNGDGSSDLASAAIGSGGGKAVLTAAALLCDYDKYGKVTASVNQKPIWLVDGLIIACEVTYDADGAGSASAAEKVIKNFKVSSAVASTGICTLTSVEDFIEGSVVTLEVLADGYKGQVVGSQWAEGSQAPDGWRDELSDTEFYAQIFKTSVPLMSGSAMATKYRGFPNEWKRIYAEHVMAHKMDIEHAMLFGQGRYVSANERYSWGLLPFIEQKGGKLYTMDYAADDGGSTLPFTYDGLVDLMEDFMAPESGNSGQKLVFTSRKVIAKMSKLGTDSFVAQSLGTTGTSPFRANLDVKPSKFAPVDVTSIGTSFGSLNFVAHPLMRGPWEDKAMCIDLSNVKYRPLAANGHNRDTFVETNIQDNSTDGRKDQIITEAGLEINLPETHALISFVA